MSNPKQAFANNSLAMDELTRYHDKNVSSTDITSPSGTLITPANQEIVHFNDYYGLNITSGNGAGSKGAFFTIDTNMYVNPQNSGSNAKFYLQFILSINGTSSVVIPFTGEFTKLASGDYQLIQKATGIGGMDEISLDLTFSRSTGATTAEFSGVINIAAPGQGESTVKGSTYNNPIVPETYIGTYYDKLGLKTLVIGAENALQYRPDGKTSMVSIDTYKFNLNMYVFSFVSPTDNNANISLVMGTAPASGLVCGDLKSIHGSNTAPTQRVLNTIKSPEKPTKVDPFAINLSSNKLAPFSAYYPTSATGGFIAIQANRITLTDGIVMYEVLIGISNDGITSTVYNFDNTMSFDDSTNTLQIPNPVFDTDTTASKYILDISFTRGYVKSGMSGNLLQLEGHVMGNQVSGSTPFNLIPLSGFMGATLTNPQGETLVVNSINDVTYKGNAVGESHSHNILYVPIMYILEFTNPAPLKPVAGEDYKVVCSFGTDAQKGLACIVTEYTLKDNVVQSQTISYYHSVPA